MRVIAVGLVFAALQAAPATVNQIQTWYQAGQYQQIVDQASQVADPKGQYLLASSYDKLGRVAEARAVFEQLAARGEGDPWAGVGRAASALLTGGGPPPPDVVESALQAARQAVSLVAGETGGGAVSSGHVFAHFQLGLVQALQNDYAGAAASFDRSIAFDPTFAYAYYYAGLSHSRMERPDQMAINFERFLQIAPQAPEAPRVQALMRSVRGR